MFQPVPPGLAAAAIPQPTPRAFILPWVVGRRVPRRRLRRAGPRRLQRTHEIIKSLTNDPNASVEEHLAPGSHGRMILADAFDEADDPHTAAALRSSDPIRVKPYANDPNKFFVHRVINGVTYDAGAPEQVIRTLENARRSGQPIRVHYGHTSGPEAGKDWLEEHGVEGRVALTRGRVSVPMLLRTSRSMYGSPLLTGSIVRIRSKGRDLYRHPQYTTPVATIRQLDKPFAQGNRIYTTTVDVDGTHWATFDSPEKARRWVRRMGLVESSNEPQQMSRRTVRVAGPR
jgi:hypothetical protein